MTPDELRERHLLEQHAADEADYRPERVLVVVGAWIGLLAAVLAPWILTGRWPW